MDLPVIDISGEESAAAHGLINAVSRYGFVYIKNTGLQLSGKDIDEMFKISHALFKLPKAEKIPFGVTSGSSGKNSGWFGMNEERLDPAKQSRGDFKEAFNMNEFVNGKAQQPLPPILKENEEITNAFIDKCYDTCLKVLRLFAIGLQVDQKAEGKNWFGLRHDRSGPSGSVFRLLYYPTLPPLDDYDKETDIRAGAHSDYGTITLLFQRPGQPGLEILQGVENGQEQWHPVPVNPLDDTELPILVNVGDLLEYWTGGLLKSAVHRVVFPEDRIGRDRYSIAYFCHPNDDARIVPVPSKMVQERVAANGNANGEVITAKQHLEQRLAATYTI